MKALLKWKKAWSMALSVALLVLFMWVPVLASSVIDMNRLGSITINISASDVGGSSPPSGMRFTAYKVAGLSDSGSYYLTDDFSGSGLQLAKLSTAYEASAASKELANYVSAKNISGISDATDSNGTVSFRNLSLGYYLVLQSFNTSDPDAGLICDPFLVAIPMKTDSSSSLVYDIVTNSKCEISCGAVILEKVNSAGSFLSNAVFRLEKKIYTSAHVPSGVQTGSDSGGNYYWSTMISSLTTDSSGQLAVTGISYGQYRFIETSAPAGYVLDSTPHGFTISEKGAIALVNGKYVASSGSVQTITVLNSNSPPPSSVPPMSSASSVVSNPGFNFPKTGGSVFYAVCTFVGLILMACGVTLFAVSRKKRK